ncbi:hypothetical protein [Paenibacillus sp.]|uniref:hypothetical protein n=1 Tax=Paenibacillus sp. TaxID=58172 RepID=UPI002D54E910|nr:hypothetical protein [Paenibacillus sp.]HZG56833.1 hypothetical protein [Paenibacillus sp.]
MSFDPQSQFAYDERLGIPTPRLTKDWNEFTAREQSEILYFWETVRGAIPDRIFAFEREIVDLQSRLDEEENFDLVCEMTWDIAERASRINDLHLYFRLNQDVATKAHH